MPAMHLCALIRSVSDTSAHFTSTRPCGQKNPDPLPPPGPKVPVHVCPAQPPPSADLSPRPNCIVLHIVIPTANTATSCENNVSVSGKIQPRILHQTSIMFKHTDQTNSKACQFCQPLPLQTSTLPPPRPIALHCTHWCCTSCDFDAANLILRCSAQADMAGLSWTLDPLRSARSHDRSYDPPPPNNH